MLIDVRSPGEFNHARIPGAVSLPLFSDEERAEVGTAYKQKSRETAIKIGLDFFGPKMRKMVEEVESLVQKNPEGNGQRDVFVYCWRGGMRSGAVAWLLDFYGFNVFQLSGGYKSFRNRALQTFEQPYSFTVLGGYTGSGKTYLLEELRKRGEKVINLEAIASHKGSAFGNINMPPQPTQEMFENLLAMELENTTGDIGMLNHDSPRLWLEDESQRIGDVNLPGSLWEQMRKSPVFFLEIPFEERLDHIVEEYGNCDPERIQNAIERIKQRLGGLETRNALQAWTEGEKKECFRILLRYYDKFYLKGLNNREALDSLLTRIPCTTVSLENAGVLLPNTRQYEKPDRRPVTP